MILEISLLNEKNHFPLKFFILEALASMLFMSIKTKPPRLMKSLDSKLGGTTLVNRIIADQIFVVVYLTLINLITILITFNNE